MCEIIVLSAISEARCMKSLYYRPFLRPDVWNHCNIGHFWGQICGKSLYYRLFMNPDVRNHRQPFLRPSVRNHFTSAISEARCVKSLYCRPFLSPNMWNHCTVGYFWGQICVKSLCSRPFLKPDFLHYPATFSRSVLFLKVIDSSLTVEPPLGNRGSSLKKIADLPGRGSRNPRFPWEKKLVSWRKLDSKAIIDFLNANH